MLMFRNEFLNTKSHGKLNMTSVTIVVKTEHKIKLKVPFIVCNF